MKNGLARRSPRIYADVIPIGMKGLLDGCPGKTDELIKRRSLALVQIKKSFAVTRGNHQCVPGRHRMSVPERGEKTVGSDQIAAVNFGTEDAIVVHASAISA